MIKTAVCFHATLWTHSAQRAAFLTVNPVRFVAALLVRVLLPSRVTRRVTSYELRVAAPSRDTGVSATRTAATSPQVHNSTTAAHPVETEGCTILGLCAPSVRQQLASVLPCQRCSGVTCFGAVSCVREDGRRCRPAVQ